MFLRKSFALLLIFMSLINCNSLGQIKDVIKVSGTFTDFNNAVKMKDGEKAIKYVSESTINYFNVIMPFVKNFNLTNTDTSYLNNKSVIDWLQGQLSNEDFVNLSDGQFLNLIISKGILQKLKLDRFHPGAIIIKGVKAKALLTTFSTEEKSECLFEKEGKQWKLNLTSVTNYLVEKAGKF